MRLMPPQRLFHKLSHKAGKWGTLVKSLIISVGIYLAYYGISFTGVRYPLNYVLIGGVAFFLFIGLYAPQFMGLSKKGEEPDLEYVYLLTHMYSVSTSKTSNTNIVGSVSNKDLYPKYAGFFRKVYLLVREYGYDFPKAALIVSKDVKRAKYLNDFLKRYAASVKVGEDAERFISVELYNNKNFYEYLYSRIMDSARVLLGVYSAVMTSVIFVIANLLVLSFIFGGSFFIIYVSFIASFASLASVAIAIWMGMPKEDVIIGGPERKKVFEIPYVVTLASIAGVLWFAILYIFGLINLDPYLLVVFSGLILLIPGTYYKMIDDYVRGVDADFPVFVRMFANNLSIIPSPFKALEPLIRIIFGRIAMATNRLYTLLGNNISFPTALKEFARKSKSELVRRASTTLGDSFKFGADMHKVGQILSDISLMIARNRRRRNQLYKTFESSVYALHMTNVLLISFITILMNIFSKALVQIRTLIPFYAIPPCIVNYLGLSVAVLLTFINAFALMSVSGSGRQLFVYYTGLLLLIGGLSAYASAMLVKYMLQPLSSIINEAMKPIP